MLGAVAHHSEQTPASSTFFKAEEAGSQSEQCAARSNCGDVVVSLQLLPGGRQHLASSATAWILNFLAHTSSSVLVYAIKERLLNLYNT